MQNNILPSVTILIGLLDKPALLNWANKIGLDGKSLEDARNESKAKGLNWHSQIENYLKQSTPFTDVDFGERFKAWIADKEIIDVEKSVRTEHFCGRFDLKYRKKGQTVIVDFKSNQRSIYYENKLQLAAYRMAEPCDRLAIISVPDMKVHRIYISNFEPYEQILIHLSKIYHLQTLVK